MSKCLYGKTWQVRAKKGKRTTWYTPLEFLKEFKSVTLAEHYNTTSSCGDWDGILVQRMNKWLWYIIPFFQENKGYGFEVSTSSRLFWTCYEEPTRKTIDECIQFLCA